MAEATRREFTVVLTEQDDGSWLATCQELPGAVSDGASVEEAQQNILEAIAGILETRYQDVHFLGEGQELRRQRVMRPVVAVS